MALIPTTSYDPTSPAGNQAISLGDDAIRLLKVQIQEVINVDHDFPSSGQAADNGQHKQVTLQEQADLGTGAVGATILGSQTVSGKGELCYVDEDDNTIQLTNQGTPIAINALSAKTTPVASDAFMLNDSADSNKTKKITLSDILKVMYPVGTVLTFGVSTNPNTLFGFGTWTAIAGRVIVGIDAGQTEFDTLNETGGEKTHLLTSSESGVPAHTHPFTSYQSAGGAGVYNGNGTPSSAGAVGANTPQDAASAHNNLQPYIVKYVWERTA